MEYTPTSARPGQSLSALSCTAPPPHPRACQSILISIYPIRSGTHTHTLRFVWRSIADGMVEKCRPYNYPVCVCNQSFSLSAFRDRQQRCCLSAAGPIFTPDGVGDGDGGGGGAPIRAAAAADRSSSRLRAFRESNCPVELVFRKHRPPCCPSVRVRATAAYGRILIRALARARSILSSGGSAHAIARLGSVGLVWARARALAAATAASYR